MDLAQRLSCVDAYVDRKILLFVNNIYIICVVYVVCYNFRLDVAKLLARRQPVRKDEDAVDEKDGEELVVKYVFSSTF